MLDEARFALNYGPRPSPTSPWLRDLERRWRDQHEQVESINESNAASDEILAACIESGLGKPSLIVFKGGDTAVVHLESRWHQFHAGGHLTAGENFGTQRDDVIFSDVLGTAHTVLAHDLARVCQLCELAFGARDAAPDKDVQETGKTSIDRRPYCGDPLMLKWLPTDEEMMSNTWMKVDPGSKTRVLSIRDEITGGKSSSTHADQRERLANELLRVVGDPSRSWFVAGAISQNAEREMGGKPKGQ